MPPDAVQLSQPLVSLIIPMLNEREGIESLFSALRSATRDVPADFELVIIDDGSTDGTKDAVLAELRDFPRWQVVALSRNFGQQAAYRAGLEAAKGQAAIFLDADLQDPPELIGSLIERWKAGFKVVTAVRTKRAETGLRRLAFDAFHWIFDHLTDSVVPANSGMFALIDRVVIDQLCAAREVSLFLPAMKSWFGFAQTTVPYERRDRAVGEPKQSLAKLMNDALNGITSYSERPLQWIAILGLLVSMASCGYAAFLVLVKLGQFAGFFLQLEVRGFTTLAVAIFLLSGVQLTCLGILGQYLGRIYREIKQRPIFVVGETLRSDESSRVR